MEARVIGMRDTVDAWCYFVCFACFVDRSYEA